MWYYYKRVAEFFIKRLEFVSEASKDVAQVFFGVLAIESLTKQSINWIIVILGLLLAGIFWFLGVISFKIK
jgi:hypothetical protein